MVQRRKAKPSLSLWARLVFSPDESEPVARGVCRDMVPVFELNTWRVIVQSDVDSILSRMDRLRREIQSMDLSLELKYDWKR
jgi:hypothetical protein